MRLPVLLSTLVLSSLAAEAHAQFILPPGRNGIPPTIRVGPQFRGGVMPTPGMGAGNPGNTGGTMNPLGGVLGNLGNLGSLGGLSGLGQPGMVGGGLGGPAAPQGARIKVVKVAKVYPESAAAEKELKPGTFIISVNRKQVRSQAELVRVIGGKEKIDLELRLADGTAEALTLVRKNGKFGFDVVPAEVQE